MTKKELFLEWMQENPDSETTQLFLNWLEDRSQLLNWLGDLYNCDWEDTEWISDKDMDSWTKFYMEAL